VPSPSLQGMNALKVSFYGNVIVWELKLTYILPLGFG
jgi:hypothetical protein